MTNSYKNYSDRDLMLALLSIECGNLDAKELGQDITDEEMAVLAEGRAEELLGAKRRDQLLCQIAMSRTLLHEWVSLSQFAADMSLQSASFRGTSDECELEEDGSAAEPQLGALDRMAQWLGQLLTPQAVFAAAIVAVLSAGVTWHFSQQAYSNSAVVYSGKPLPNKASVHRDNHTDLPVVDASNSLAGITQALNQRLKCLKIDQGTGTSLCYSNTEHIQHWYLVEPNDRVSAIPAPVVSDEIVSVGVAYSTLLLESVSGSAFQLRLFGINLNDQSVSFELKYQDQIEAGFFDELKLDEKGLSYLIKRENGDEQRKTFEF
ncbi:MAG: hypothetical protein D6160_09385 [Ketobacter sp.]|nr:MAG: hypothetical protein D6160_09385 [Ketobacter sp.]